MASLMGRRARWVVHCVVLLSISGCNGVAVPQTAPTPARRSAPAVSGHSPSPAATAAGSVFVIVMENKSYDEALGGT